MDQKKFETILNEHLEKALMENPGSEIGEAFNSGVRTMYNLALSAMYRAIDYQKEDAK